MKTTCVIAACLMLAACASGAGGAGQAIGTAAVIAENALDAYCSKTTTEAARVAVRSALSGGVRLVDCAAYRRERAAAEGQP
jgi:hypothetical protein